MKKLFNTVLSHPLISGVLYVFIGSFGASSIHFLFNLYMVKHLSDIEYGILGSVNSFTSLPGLVAGAIVPVVITFAASSFASNELHTVRNLFLKINKFVLYFGIPIFLALLLATPYFSTFFKIPSYTIFIIADFIILVNLLGVINGSFLNAKLAFRFIAFYQILAAVLKLGLGVFFVSSGMKADGAILAIFIAFIIPYLITFVPLKFVFQKGSGKSEIAVKQLFSYGIPAAVALLSLNMFITSDILLVKHFYNPKEAGLFAAITLIGKIIFFFSSPIAAVMFPLVVQKQAKRENYFGVFALSLLFVLGSSLSITIFYYLFPFFTVQFVTKNAYFEATKYIGFYGLYITVFSLLTVLTNFFLSIKKVNVYIPLLIGAVIQFGLIWQFHSTFMKVMVNSFIVASLLMLGLLLYYLYLFLYRDK